MERTFGRIGPSPPAWRILLANIGLYTALVPATLICAAMASLTAWIPPRGRYMLFFARVWAWLILTAAGIRLELELDPYWNDADDDGRYVFMANHASYVDVPVLLAILPSEVRFAAKRSLFLIPVFGWALAAGGFIPVDRRDRSKARKVFTTAGDRLAKGASVLFFPEGSRSPDGRLQELERGGFLVALKSGLPIVPVGVEGAWPLLPRHTLRIHPGTVRVRVGAPIDTADLGVRDRRRLVSEVRTSITRLARLDTDHQADG